MVAFAFGIVPYLEYYGTEATPTPAYCTELLRIVVLLVDDVNLIEYFLDFFEAYAMFSFDLATLLFIELKPHRWYITVIPSNGSGETADPYGRGADRVAS